MIGDPTAPAAPHHPARKPASRVDGLWYLLIAGWFLAAFGGVAWTWSYKLRPAAVLEAPTQWPAESFIHLAPEGATLVMLAHPRCPCTRASLGELARLMSDARGRVAGHVLVVRPPGTPESWERTDLWELAAKIPGVTVHADVDGNEVKRFGAVVSGYVLVYDEKGRLLFHGGITGARGHEGDNPGRDAATAAILRGAGGGAPPTFGCELLNAEERARSEDAPPAREP